MKSTELPEALRKEGKRFFIDLYNGGSELMEKQKAKCVERLVSLKTKYEKEQGEIKNIKSLILEQQKVIAAVSGQEYEREEWYISG